MDDQFKLHGETWPTDAGESMPERERWISLRDRADHKTMTYPVYPGASEKSQPDRARS
jgi:hypothetical protein